jgi:hypothetical protein
MVDGVLGEVVPPVVPVAPVVPVVPAGGAASATVSPTNTLRTKAAPSIVTRMKHSY